MSPAAPPMKGGLIFIVPGAAGDRPAKPKTSSGFLASRISPCREADGVSRIPGCNPITPSWNSKEDFNIVKGRPSNVDLAPI